VNFSHIPKIKILGRDTCREIDALLQVEPMKVVPASPLLGERLRSLK
jgi:hypothetical protein